MNSKQDACSDDDFVSVGEELSPRSSFVLTCAPGDEADDGTSRRWEDPGIKKTGSQAHWKVAKSPEARSSFSTAIAPSDLLSSVRQEQEHRHAGALASSAARLLALPQGSGVQVGKEQAHGLARVRRHGREDLLTSLPSTEPASGARPEDIAHMQRVAQLVIKDRETGREYMLCEGSDQCDGASSSQTLVDLNSMTTTVFQYNTMPRMSESQLPMSDTAAASAPLQASSISDTVASNLLPTLTSPPAETPKRKGTRWLRGMLTTPKSNLARGAGTPELTQRPLSPCVTVEAPSLGSVGASGGSVAVSDESSSSQTDVSSLQASRRHALPSVQRSHSQATKGSQESVRVWAHRKVFREFTDLRHTQTLFGHKGAVWKVAFSDTGVFMASGGQDCIVRVWKSLRAPHDRTCQQPGCPSSPHPAGVEVDAPIVPDDAASTAAAGACLPFQAHPYKEFGGHMGAVLDLSWSANLFLLSASRDCTVRLWHINRDGALKVFRHDDCVMAVAFHPVDSRHFLSCSWNGKVRLQRAEPPKVIDWKQLQLLDPLPVQCAAFSARGDIAYVGALRGRIRQYQIPSSMHLRYHAEIDVREKRKRRADVPVSGLDVLPQRPGCLLVTTRDSRLRLYQGTTQQTVKFKGLRNKATSMIRATFSQDGLFVICGSDDGTVYIWRTDSEASVCLPRASGSYTPSEGRLKSDSFEAFRGAPELCTVAMFAPAVSEPQALAPPPFMTSTRSSVDTSGGGEASLDGSTGISAKSHAAIKEIIKQHNVDPRDVSEASKRAHATGCKLQGYSRLIIVACISGDLFLYENFGSAAWL